MGRGLGINVFVKWRGHLSNREDIEGFFWKKNIERGGLLSKRERGEGALGKSALSSSSLL